MKTGHKQQGFVLLLFIVVVTIIVTLWVSTKHERIISFFKTNQIDIDVAELSLAKERLLQYALLQPEIYLTNGAGEILDADSIPGPGYFPCPDLNGDGDVGKDGVTDCTNPLIPASSETTGFVPDLTSDPTAFGWLPQSISSRNIYFADKKRYYYFLDERFSYKNGNYPNDGLNRYAPLFPSRLVGDVADASDSLDPFMPVLTLNGVDGYIALLIDPGNDGLDAANKDPDRHFFSGANDLSNDPNGDKIVGITYTEWLYLVVHRVCAERARVMGIDYDENDADAFDSIEDLDDIGDTVKHWYNDYDAAARPGGNHWRSWGIVCP